MLSILFNTLDTSIPSVLEYYEKVVAIIISLKVSKKGMMASRGERIRLGLARSRHCVKLVAGDTMAYILLRVSPVAARLAVPKQPKQRMSCLSRAVTGNYTLTVT